MAKPILMPQVGQDLTEGKLIEWRVKVGDRVGKGDIVAVVESEKASFEVEAFESGTVLRLLYEEGATTEVLAPLAFLGEPGEAAAPLDPAGAPAAGAAGPAPALAAVAPPLDHDVARKPVPTFRHPAPGGADAKPRSSPLARRRAREGALDLAAVRGSGPQGAVVRRDVEAALAAAEAEASVAAPLAPSPPASGLHRVWLRKGTGAPLLLIHGFGADHNAWRGMVGAAALSRPVLALDLPGHGLSPPPAAVNWDDMVAAIARTLRDEGVEAADIVGHSLGAALAVSLAEAARFTVRSLFLIAPAGLGPDINGAFLDGFARSTGEASLAPWMRLLACDETAVGPALVRVTARTRAEPGVREAQLRLREALFPDGTQAVSVRHALGRFACPVRVVFGADDRIIPARHALGLPGTVAVHMFPGTGHMPHIEARDAVARLLCEHLRSAA